MSQDTFGQAMEILRDHARGLGYYHLAAADHEMLGIEGIQDDYEIIAPEDHILVHSNHYLTERFKGHDLAGLMVPDSFGRVERIRALIKEQYGKITPEIMMAMLCDHDGHPCSICRHADTNLPMEAASETLSAYVMVPETGTMYIAWGNPCQYEFEEYRLK